MTKQKVNEIKKILKKENAEYQATYHDRNGELRIKVDEFILTSKLGWEITLKPLKERETETRTLIIKILRALEKNGLRPEYRLEQRNTSNALGTWDSRYIIFK